MMGYKVWVYSKAQELDINDPRTISLVRDLSVIMEQFGIACVDFDWGLTGADENSFSVAYYRHGKIREERFKANL